MSENELLKAILTVMGANLLALVTIGIKGLRIFHRLELKHNLMWADYEHRKGITESEL